MTSGLEMEQVLLYSSRGPQGADVLSEECDLSGFCEQLRVHISPDVTDDSHRALQEQNPDRRRLTTHYTVRNNWAVMQDTRKIISNDFC